MTNILKLSVSILLLFVISCKTSEPVVDVVKSSQKEVTALTLGNISGATSTFDASTNTHTFSVPSGTNIKALALTFTLPNGATSSPASGSVQDFTNPVSYTITAEDGTKMVIKIAVNVQGGSKSSLKQIIDFSFYNLNPVVKANIDETNKKITATVSATTDLTKLSPSILLTPKTTISPGSNTVQNFSNPVIYDVTAENGSKVKYEVMIKKAIDTKIINAQLVWSKFWGGTNDEHLQFFTPTSNDGFIFGGLTNSDKSGNRLFDIKYESTLVGVHNINFNCWKIRIDKDGKEIWQYSLPNEWIANYAPAPDNFNNRLNNEHYIGALVLSSSDNYDVYSPYGSHYTFGQNYIGDLATSNSVSVLSTKDGNILLATSSQNDYLGLFKIDIYGKIIWRKGISTASKTYHPTGYDRIYRVKILENIKGDIYIGCSKGNKNISGNESNTDIFLTKLNANGDIIWQKQFDTPYTDIFGDMIFAKDGSLLVASSKTELSNGTLGSILNISESGILNNELIIDMLKYLDKYPASYLNKIIPLKNGDYLTVGSSNNEGMIIVIDKTFNIKYKISLIEFGIEDITFVSETNTNEVVIASTSKGNSKYPSFGKTDFRICKIKW